LVDKTLSVTKIVRETKVTAFETAKTLTIFFKVHEASWRFGWRRPRDATVGDESRENGFPPTILPVDG